MTPTLPDNLRLLLVDDEENILRSLKRLLRREPYELVTAESGEAALRILENERIDLVISDARMPGMDGPSLLSLIRRRWPWVIRILLTGYADMESTVKAINDGQIYRYISKPWEDEELKVIVRQALAFQYSERRRLALEKLSRKQNRQLRALNENLEQQVESRTAELKETADMLDRALSELRTSYVTTTEVFSSLLNQRLPRDLQTNGRVIAVARAFAQHLELDAELTRNLEMASALYNLGKLSWSDDMLRAPSDQLTKAQTKTYRQYPEAGEQLLMTLEPLQEAAHIIRHHQERWSGRGFPDELAGDAIPLGSRILRMAVDFIELQTGLIISRRVSRDDALKLVERQSGRLYDPALCGAFVALCEGTAPDLAPTEEGVIAVDTRQLKAGMILARDLHAASGMLLLNEGKQLTRPLIEKLIAFERGEPEGTRYILFIHDPEVPEEPLMEVGIQ
ncbi:Response regulator c-di-GMP phosphodiesterase, RpfG family, contains REC and HD-GYP domains [Marinobacter daqiaonensis]|uniref:Response regulator c-di-GMP phosphodiesterase, RpfG family, contains REC and HD-GYP domains n=1 Tax=Marinobacter daqiaonensis TaxID=650891 RepID=A0A1I6IKS6_9GAMM|nr:HD domain-containing phosphohydrolase [Marinobacter daqiaonensis]SFR67284.1 Response regulator c-di-GMP phosphodiesterase, RpfG family, contains REC and HD-GYP domains [Marinobacter daqiaonensis]